MATSSNQLPLDEAINKMRDNILRTQSNSNTAAITGFDNMVNQLQIFAQQINEKNVEIKRMQHLCKKNNIDFAIPVEKPVYHEKVTTPETTKPVTLKPKN